MQAKVKIPLCKEHHDEQYCETCDELVCVYCTVKKHSSHHHDSVKQMATKHRKELKITEKEWLRIFLKHMTTLKDEEYKKMRWRSREKIEQYLWIDTKADETTNQVKQQACDTASMKMKVLKIQLEEATPCNASWASEYSWNLLMLWTKALIKKHYLQRNKSVILYSKWQTDTRS